MGGPYRIAPCDTLRLSAPDTYDACGRIRDLRWDVNHDGIYSDAYGSQPFVYTSSYDNFFPGVHAVRVKSYSSPACPASPTEVHTVNVTVTAGDKLAIFSISTRPLSNNPVATTGEDIYVLITSRYIYCLSVTVVVDCGAGSDPADDVTPERALCRYNTPGQKVIIATFTQNGVSVLRSRNITIAAN
eukprot:jgi/Chlat1/1518/Chrsp120S01795